MRLRRRDIGDLSTLGDTHSCIVRLTDCFSSIGISPVPRDPWGSPYLLDENELEWWDCDPCRRDFIRSAGLDRQIGSFSVEESEQYCAPVGPCTFCSLIWEDEEENWDNINLPIPFYSCSG